MPVIAFLGNMRLIELIVILLGLGCCGLVVAGVVFFIYMKKKKNEPKP